MRLGQIGWWSRRALRNRGLDISASPRATEAECTTTSDFFIAGTDDDQPLDRERAAKPEPDDTDSASGVKAF
jgi:hypothetical protein